jgi:hemerythrin
VETREFRGTPSASNLQIEFFRNLLEQAKQFVADHANCSDQEAADLLGSLRREQQQNSK